MKKYRSILLAGLIGVLAGCTHDPISDLENDISITSFTSEPETNTKNPGRDIISYAEELVIRYKYDVTDQLKRVLRNRYGVRHYKKCACGDEQLELWMFEKPLDDLLLTIEANPDIDIDINPDIDTQEKKRQARAKARLEEIDINASLNTDNYIDWIRPDKEAFYSKIVSYNKGVTIAVLDTGFNPGYEGFQQPLIYNTDISGRVKGLEGYGGDFVNRYNYPADDNGHGTVITYFIASVLEKYDIRYQVLPIKIADKDGKASYFDLLCGFKYALSKPGLDIINLSLGWYGKPSWFLSQFIAEAKARRILIIASAGNGRSNNDSEPHFPSSYPDENIISVAGMNKNINGLAWYSNYGKHSVDFAAPSERIPFKINKKRYFVSGTSFACAYATAYAALLRSKHIPPGDIKLYIARSAVFSRRLEGVIKYPVYIPYQP